MSTSKGASTYNRPNWEESKFPQLCQTCLGDNHYIRMKKEKHQKECKTCKESFIVSRWCPGARMRFKKTEVCQTCSHDKNICQSCLSDLENDAVLRVPKSDDLQRYLDIPKLEPPEDKTITTLYVGGLGEKVDADDLKNHFHQFGEIRPINMVHKQQCTFVQFTNRLSSEAAAESSSNRLIIKGQRLIIQWSRPPGQQQSTNKGENEEEEMVQSTRALTMPPQDNGKKYFNLPPPPTMTAPFLGRGGPGPPSGIKMEYPSQNPYSGEMGKVSNARVQSRYPDQNRKRRLRFKLYIKHKHNTKLKYLSQNPCSGEMGKFSNARLQSRYPDQNRKRRHMLKLYSTRFMYRRHSTRLKYLSQNPNRNMSEFVFNSEVMIKKKKKKKKTVKNEIHVTNVDVLQCGQNNTLVYNKISSATDDERQRVDNSTITIYYGKKAKVYSCPKSAAVFVIFGDHCMIDVHELKELAETTEEEDMSDSDDEWENS